MIDIKNKKYADPVRYIDESLENSGLFAIVMRIFRFFVNLIKNSFFFSLLFKLAMLFANFLSKLWIVRFFTHEFDDEAVLTGSLLGLFRDKLHFFKDFSKKMKRETAFAFENSYIVGFVKGLFKNIPSHGLHSAGVLLFSFGSAGAIFRSIRYYVDLKAIGANFEINASLFTPFSGLLSMETMFLILLAFLGLLLMTSKKTIGEGICQSVIFSFVFFGVFALDKNNILLPRTKKQNIGLFVTIGIVFAIISIFINPILPFAAIIALIGIYIIMSKPETGVILLFLALPFLPTMLLAALIIFTFFAFIIKFIRGKRVIRFNLCDILILLFAVILMFGGILSVGGMSSLPPAAMYICFMMSYFLIKNLITSREAVKRSATVMFVSAGVVALYGIYQYFFTSSSGKWIDTDMFSEIKSRVVSTFDNPNVLGEYLIMVIPIVLGALLVSKNARFGIFHLGCLALSGACLIFTWSRGAWLGFLLSAVVFFIVLDRRTMVALTAGILAIPLLPFILPDSIISRFTSIGNLSDSSTSYRVFIWLGTLKMLKKCAVGGIGIGEGAFRSVYPRFSYSAIEKAPHSHNLFMQLCVEMGIFAVIFYLIILVVFTQKCISFAVCNKKRDKAMSLIVIGCLSGVAAITVQSMTDYTWYNYRVFLMFWLVFSLAISAIYASKAEQVSDESLTV